MRLGSRFARGVFESMGEKEWKKGKSGRQASGGRKKGASSFLMLGGAKFVGEKGTGGQQNCTISATTKGWSKRGEGEGSSGGVTVKKEEVRDILYLNVFEKKGGLGEKKGEKEKRDGRIKELD